MMMRRAIRILAGAVVCLVMMLLCLRAPAAEQDQNKKDLDAMQGTWSIQKWLLQGASAPAGAIGGSMTIKGDQLIAMGGSDNPATLKLDSAKDPAAIDFIDKRSSTDRGIYNLDGDTLTFCMALSGSGKDRPTVFESTKDNGYMLIVLKRQIPK
jgi:uncharacterized protein (TIGR03067 family)